MRRGRAAFPGIRSNGVAENGSTCRHRTALHARPHLTPGLDPCDHGSGPHRAIAVSESAPVAGNAADIARATLKHMAQHRMVPTPQNYAAAWEIIAGTLDPKTQPMIRMDPAGSPAVAGSGQSGPTGAPARESANLVAEAAEAVRLANRRSRLMASMTELIETICQVVPTLLEDEKWVAEQFGSLRRAVHPDEGLPDRGEIEQARSLLAATAVEHRKLMALRRDSLTGLKAMLTQWMGSLAQLSESSRGYGDRLGGFVDRIQTVNSLDDLTSALADIVEDTAAARARIDLTRTDIEQSCKRAEELESKVNSLAEQLTETSAKLATDHLTELLNRRGLEEAFSEVWSACQGQGKPLSIALLDIDDFKKINDSLGHLAGDDALRQFATLLRGQLRPNDRCARYGGEEFVLLLPGAPLEGAVEAVRRLQRSMAERALLGGPGRANPTFSGGVSEVPDGLLARALERADDALYEAKRAGKNRVCSR